MLQWPQRPSHHLERLRSNAPIPRSTGRPHTSDQIPSIKHQQSDTIDRTPTHSSCKSFAGWKNHGLQVFFHFPDFSKALRAHCLQIIQTADSRPGCLEQSTRMEVA
ncbi:hypothetical protein O6H91_13G024300 [Diphasiastrum complanatum]|uniref:Uncharacterized protein n=1 Tax=Diphasiastrum complanatum TaxID=34168 RepID=A0ACC2BSX1_DIPCM|nr:hypothetical protein O6H91_13G024300 [Diphasiastrum complanatum]